MVKVLNRDKILRFFNVAGGAGGSGGGSGSFDPSMLMGLVDLTSEQTITGQKTFASQILSTVDTGTAPFSIASTTLVSNLNADLLDGVHASGLFTALAMDSNALSITIGGTTKSLTVGYATKAAQDDEGSTIKTTYLKKTDADTTYIKIAFFSRLFQAYNGNTAVNPNDLTTTIDNIKAMFGFWTDFYLSALGSGGPSTPSFSLASLSDVDVTGVTNGQALVYNSTSAKWVPGTISTGVDMNVVWSALAAATNEQINASHLTTAAAGFFTSLTMSGNDLSITIGGTTKTLTVGYASNANYATSAGTAGSASTASSAGNLLTSDTAQDANDCYSTNAGLHYYRTNGNDMPNNNDGFILQWAYGDGYLVGQQLFFDDNATGVMKIRGKDVDGTFTNWWQIYTDKYHPNADYATLAGSASSADYATSAGSASSANYATSAGNAGYLSVYNKTIWGQTYWNSNGQPQNVTGNLYLGDYALYIGNGNYSYINAAYSNSQWAIGFKPGGTSVAEVNQSGFYCNGYVTALSDIRFKNVVERMDIDVKRIAEMSIIKFLWNDRDEGGKLHVGCVAQEWESLLPWTVQEVNGKKSLDYSVAALVSVVAVARKVESHEERIARLERELAKERALLSKESRRKGES